MNKTVSINLGGLFFHIDENAYQKLNRYFDAIRRSLSPDGKDEIMSDIEARIAELLSEKLNSDKQVVSQREIDEVIAIMGKPEDYRIDEEGPAGSTTSATGTASEKFEYYRTKKFYRDSENSVIAGVCAGLAHYVRVDPLWIRILFILTLIIFVGTTSIAYLLLWVLIPPALTTAEKLEMRGEPINISNIEKKVREEFAQVGDKIKNVDYDKLGSNVKTGAERVGSGVGYVAKGFFKVLAKIVGAVITIFSGFTLGGLLVGFIIILFAAAVTPAWYPYATLMNSSGAPLWLVSLCTFFAIGIPMLGLFLLGLRILVDNLKPIGNLAGFGLLVVWIVSICGAAYMGLKQAAHFGTEGKTIVKQQIPYSKADTLNVKFTYNNYFEKSVNGYYHDFTIKQDSLGNEVIYSNDVRLIVLKAEGSDPYVQIEKIAKGSSIADAREAATNIKYNFKFDGKTLILDNYLLTPPQTKWHGEKIEIYLYLPEGYHFKPDASVKQYDVSDDNFFNLWFDNDNHIYRMDSDNVNCLDCVEEIAPDAEAGMVPPPPADGVNITPPPPGVAPEAEDDLARREREIHLKERELELKLRERELQGQKK